MSESKGRSPKRSDELKRARRRYRKIVPAGESLADELIADRRREADSEE